MPEKPERKFGKGETHKQNVLRLVKALLLLEKKELSPDELPASAVKVAWVSDNELRVTGENQIKKQIVEGTTKQALWELVEKTNNSLQLPQRQQENAFVNIQQRQPDVVQNVFDYLKELGILKDERPQNKKNTKYWIFTLTLKHKDASIEENLSVVTQKLDLETVPQIIDSSTSIDWREVCTAMLKSQQEAARLRRKATEQGFEVNVYVPLGLVERKQQQRRQLNEYRDRENVYGLSEEVIVKTYEHGTFLREVIAQPPDGDHKHIAIIGEPGAGKSTLLSTIASFIKDETQDLPIFISLANLQGRTIEEYLLKQWLTEAMKAAKHYVVVTPEIERQLIECFAKGGVWLLLDGVDEMGENSPVQALAKINQELTASLRQARVVLTCRLNVWDAKVNNTLTGFDTYKTQEFKPEDIDDFIQQWFECAGNSQKGQTLQTKLQEPQHQNILKLVTNPLRLSLLCQTFYLDKQEELPETKATLYQGFTYSFYEWKSELFPQLCNSDDLKQELHHALSKLAFAGINSSARFRLRQSLAHKQMGERLFKLACDVGWLNLVERVEGIQEEVYAFFHPNFQEYFAALNVNHWHEFLHHVADKPTQGTYRIFQPQWREVILLWLGRREEELKQQQQEFIYTLVNFKDGCGEWNREDVDKGFYEYQAYFLAAVGIAEFKDYSQADEIVNQLVKWGFGYSSKEQKWVKFLAPIPEEARSALQQTDRTKAIAALVQLLQSPNVNDFTRWQAADSLEKIGTGNQDAIAALVQLLQSPDVDNSTRKQAAESLRKIGTRNQDAIAALVQLLQSPDVNIDTYIQAAESLRKIDPGNQEAIAALVQLLQSPDVYNDIRMWAADSLGEIGTGNQEAIAALVQLLQSPNVNDFTRSRAADSLGEIGTGNQEAIAALVQLLQSSNMDNLTRMQAADSLGKISPGNQEAIAALVQLLHSPDVDNLTRMRAANSLGEIGTGNQEAITALVQLLQSPNMDNLIRMQAADSLGKISPGNQEAIAALVQLLHSPDVGNLTRLRAANSLEEIGTGNQEAIAALVQLLQSPNMDNYTRWLAVDSLGKISQGNQEAIAALVQLLHSPDVDNLTRLRATNSLGGIGTGNQEAIAALVQLLHSPDVDNLTRMQAANSLEEIGPGNQEAIAALVQLLQSPDVDDFTRRQAANSLGKILHDDNHRFLAIAGLKNYWQLDHNYSVIWKCSQNMFYPDFYKAWHPEINEEASINYLDLLQRLQAAINNDSPLSQNIHLICIDTSKFIDPDNPASKIYTAIVQAGCSKCLDGTPRTMAELQTYWDLLETDTRVVLVFHPGATNNIGEVTYSNAFLNAISKFEGTICFINNPIPNCNTLKVFAPTQPVDEILEWLRCNCL